MSGRLSAGFTFAVMVYRDLLRRRRAGSLLEWFDLAADIDRARLAIDDAVLHPGNRPWAPPKTSGQSRPAEGENTVKAKKAAKKNLTTKTKTKTVKRAPAKTAKKGKR